MSQTSDTAAHDLAHHIKGVIAALHAHSDAGTIAAALILTALDLFAISGQATPEEAQQKLVDFILAFRPHKEAA